MSNVYIVLQTNIDEASQCFGVYDTEEKAAARVRYLREAEKRAVDWDILTLNEDVSGWSL